jgi:hypothetical protein
MQRIAAAELEPHLSGVSLPDRVELSDRSRSNSELAADPDPGSERESGLVRRGRVQR